MRPVLREISLLSLYQREWLNAPGLHPNGQGALPRSGTYWVHGHARRRTLRSRGRVCRLPGADSFRGYHKSAPPITLPRDIDRTGR